MPKKTNCRSRQPRAMFIEGLMGKGWTRKKASDAWTAWQRSQGQLLNHNESDEVMNYAQAAKFIGVAEGTLRHWVSTGLNGVPHIKYGRGGGRVRFLRSSLGAWMASRERNRVAPAPATESTLEAR